MACAHAGGNNSGNAADGGGDAAASINADGLWLQLHEFTAAWLPHEAHTLMWSGTGIGAGRQDGNIAERTYLTQHEMSKVDVYDADDAALPTIPDRRPDSAGLVPEFWTAACRQRQDDRSEIFGQTTAEGAVHIVDLNDEALPIASNIGNMRFSSNRWMPQGCTRPDSDGPELQNTQSRTEGAVDLAVAASPQESMTCVPRATPLHSAGQDGFHGRVLVGGRVSHQGVRCERSISLPRTDEVVTAESLAESVANMEGTEAPVPAADEITDEPRLESVYACDHMMQHVDVYDENDASLPVTSAREPLKQRSGAAGWIPESLTVESLTVACTVPLSDGPEICGAQSLAEGAVRLTDEEAMLIKQQVFKETEPLREKMFVFDRRMAEVDRYDPRDADSPRKSNITVATPKDAAQSRADLRHIAPLAPPPQPESSADTAAPPDNVLPDDADVQEKTFTCNHCVSRVDVYDVSDAALPVLPDATPRSQVSSLMPDLLLEACSKPRDHGPELDSLRWQPRDHGPEGAVKLTGIESALVGVADSKLTAAYDAHLAGKQSSPAAQRMLQVGGPETKVHDSQGSSLPVQGRTLTTRQNSPTVDEYALS
eukprot:gnl/TRDRNA2_/TRDRNA2_205727_c0_seq1.p1 gnl/TRDRNA2_/TRDRNA2_205727_c0~~gnl/TRDRNA2_/TRDRNA2_205727_c0_seq1.p1  ORF type:complete len:618 (+),score=67.64 gnl/TRDRNA2_/TRDRNA2_205727_c0_seq1:60-1856(+)